MSSGEAYGWTNWEWDNVEGLHRRYNRYTDECEWSEEDPFSASYTGGFTPRDTPSSFQNMSTSASTYPGSSPSQAGPSLQESFHTYDTNQTAFQSQNPVSQAYGGGFDMASQTTFPTSTNLPGFSHISTQDTSRQYEHEDKNFKTHKSKDFKFGRVLKMLWTEPRGNNNTVITPIGKNRDHSKVRRFVLVGEHQGHSIGLSIVTYGGQGTSKGGCHPRDHAVIYSGHHQPPLIHGENANLLRHPIRCKMDSDRLKLDTASRLNYAKLYTIEHNVKVQFIGSISTSSQSRLIADYNDIHRPLQDHVVQSSTGNEYTYATGGIINQQQPYQSMNTGYGSNDFGTANPQDYPYPDQIP